VTPEAVAELTPHPKARRSVADRELGRLPTGPDVNRVHDTFVAQLAARFTIHEPADTPRRWQLGDAIPA